MRHWALAGSAVEFDFDERGQIIICKAGRVSVRPARINMELSLVAAPVKCVISNNPGAF
jgi:hypothetical protein